MDKIKLTNWKVSGALPYQSDFSTHIQKGVEMLNETKWIDATVPGSVYQDLERAGIIEDPLFESNSLKCEWVANRWWAYKTEFTLTESDLKDVLLLHFKGIDYAARIYLNGEFLGRHEGMYIPFEAVINDYAKAGETNVLVCIIEHAPFADPQPGYTSKTHYLKARYDYKWDFSIRLVNLGIYDEVYITKHNIASITHSFARPVKTEDGWDVEIEVEAEGYFEGLADINVAMIYDTKYGDSELYANKEIEIKKGYNKFKTVLSLASLGFVPELWYPNGYGGHKLYPVNIEIVHGKRISDTASHKIGFRTLEYVHADGREDALPYGFRVNGKRVYLKGTNIVPLDELFGCVTEEKLDAILTAAKQANINYFRIWGGGHIESEAFYSKCDELGIMILQEFTMSSSGCDDVPSRDEHFLSLLKKAVLYNGKLKRNHVSLSLWDGGNELSDEKFMGRPDHEGHPASFEDSTLAMIKGILSEICPDIMMLPSSGSGPNALLKVGDVGNNHDVHGPWGYVGVEKHYETYNNSDSIVHGEFGCGGMENLEALKKFLSEENLKLQLSENNRVWAHRSSGWDCYYSRERSMYGDLDNMAFSDYIDVSQFTQAEALRYALEANRRRQWENVGEMTWQFNEPCPNVQCSNVVDYYGGKKLGYYFLKEAYEPVLTSLRYYKFFYQKGDEFKAEINIINDNADADFTIDFIVETVGGEVLESGSVTGVAYEDQPRYVKELKIKLPEEITGGFIVKLSTQCGNYKGYKEYLMLIADIDKKFELSDYQKLRLTVETKRWYANGLDNLKANPEVVLDFVKSYRKNI